MADNKDVVPKITKEIIFPGEGDLLQFDNGSKVREK
jgi:hypothetical protein